MHKLASKVATYLLAPVLLGASCLACLVQATPVYAAPVAMERGMEQSQDCANYKKPTDSAKPVSGVRMETQTGTSAIHQGLMAHSNHGCASSTENAAFENKTRQISFGLSAPVILSTPLDRAEFPNQISDSGIYRPFPQKENFLTGCVIKRE